MMPVDTIIADSVRGEPDIGAIASVDAAKSRLTVLLWNYHDVAGGTDDRRDCAAHARGSSAHRETAREPPNIRSTKHSGNAYTAWLAMGSPQSPTAGQIAQLHAASKMRAVARDLTRANGNAEVTVVLPRQSVKLIEIELVRKP